jgi:hypothetical protein
LVPPSTGAPAANTIRPSRNDIAAGHARRTRLKRRVERRLLPFATKTYPSTALGIHEGLHFGVVK